MTLEKDRLKHLARAALPPPLSRTARRMAASWWYYRELNRARTGFAEHGSSYPRSTLFIAGLPKSGTTWVKKMLTAYPGFREISLPEATAFELATGGSHNFDLPAGVFDRFSEALVVLKMHVHASVQNRRLLHGAGVPYIVLYRDLRDVAVSGFFYIRATPWHPLHSAYRGLSPETGVTKFLREHIRQYAQWVLDWRNLRDPRLSIEVRYEDLVADTQHEFGRIARHFALDDAPEIITRIVHANAFEHLSGGRRRGREDTTSFYRKGVAGDWKNYFTPAMTSVLEAELEGLDLRSVF